MEVNSINYIISMYYWWGGVGWKRTNSLLKPLISNSGALKTLIFSYKGIKKP